jgi:hypothetical protein
VRDILISILWSHSFGFPPPVSRDNYPGHHHNSGYPGQFAGNYAPPQGPPTPYAPPPGPPSSSYGAPPGPPSGRQGPPSQYPPPPGAPGNYPPPPGPPRGYGAPPPQYVVRKIFALIDASRSSEWAVDTLIVLLQVGRCCNIKVASHHNVLNRRAPTEATRSTTVLRPSDARAQSDAAIFFPIFSM